MIKKMLVLFFIINLFSCGVEKKYTGKWVAEEWAFQGMSMEIKSNGDVILFDVPEVRLKIFFKGEEETPLTAEDNIIDPCKEAHGRFDKQTHEIFVTMNGIEKRHKIRFADGETLELLLDNGSIIFFEKSRTKAKSNGSK